MNDTTAYASIYTPTLKDKISYRLFPSHYDEKPEEPKFPSKDYLRADISIEMSFIDRVRFLISGRMEIRYAVHTEGVIGNTCANATSYVVRPRFLENKA